MRARSTRRRALALTAAVAALALTLSGCAAGGPITLELPEQTAAAFPAETQTVLEAAVTHAMGAAAASGAIIGVWAPWSGSWVAGLGTTSAGGETPVTKSMAFRAADLTRPMICDVLYGLAADGRVGLNDPVTEHAAGVPDLSNVTLVQLCDGSSGIGSYEPSLKAMWATNPERVWDARDIASYGLGRARTSAPGDAFTDSDAGYVLLGLALENATKSAAAQLLNEYVFTPLALPNTVLPGDAPAIPAPGAMPGFQIGRGETGAPDCAVMQDMTKLSSSIGFTDSGVVTNVTDLGRYMQALAAGSLLEAKSGGDKKSPAGKLAAKRFAKPLAMAPDAPAWYTSTGGVVQAGSLIGQFGAMPGYMTAAYADPATGLVVVAVLNNSTANPALVRDLAWQLAAIASKAPAAAGETAPEFGLPWTAEQYGEEITALAVCQPA